MLKEKDINKNKYLVFSIGKEYYGISLNFVSEIIGIQEITQIPELPKHLKGIINLRGKIIPVADLRIRFNMEEREYDERTCIIVIQKEDITIGFIVDRVEEVVDLNNISNPPNRSTGLETGFIEGIGKLKERIILLLDLEKLYDISEIQFITNDTESL